MSDGDATRRMRDCAQVIADDRQQILSVRSHHHAAIDGLLRRRLTQLMTTVRYLRVLKDSPISNALLAARQIMVIKV